MVVVLLLAGCGQPSEPRSSFDAQVTRFAAETHAQRVPVAALPGVVCFQLAHARAQASIERWNRDYLGRGAYVFRYENTRGLTAGGDTIALLPTRDKWRVLRTVGQTAATIAWLRRLDKWHPFTVYGAGVDFVEGRFESRPHGQDAVTLARSMARFDPAIGSARELARTLETTGSLNLWWD